jgi:hypothetical protein
MAGPVRLRGDFDGSRIRALAKRRRDAGQLRRFLTLFEIYGGRSRGEAARITTSACSAAMASTGCVRVLKEGGS